MNQTKRTAKLRNIRLALTRMFIALGARPEWVAPAVEATMARLLDMPNIQLRRFARIVGA